MFENLKNIFVQEEQQPETFDSAERVKIATCVLMLEVARVDEEFSDDERDRILTTLRERYTLSDADAEELMQVSTESREQSADVWHFTNQINKLCKEEEKIEIIEEVWRVVVADGGIHGSETHFMRRLAKLLNLARHQVIDAKVKILEEVRGAG